MPETVDWCALLGEARAAYHSLLSGKAVVSFRDQNNEQVQYAQANVGNLTAYIRMLEGLCNPCAGRSNRTRPLGFLF